MMFFVRKAAPAAFLTLFNSLPAQNTKRRRIGVIEADIGDSSSRDAGGLLESFVELDVNALKDKEELIWPMKFPHRTCG